MVQAFLKRNGILLVTFAVYLATVLGIVGLIDAAFYQTRKRDIIFDYANQIFPKDVQDSVESLARGWRMALSRSPRDEAAFDSLREQARKLVSGPTSIFEIIVRDGEGNVVSDEKADKFRRFNHFSNSLWLPWFSRRVSQEFYEPSSGKSMGWYTYYFTTPDTLPAEAQAEIAGLTARYRLGTLAIAGLLTALTALFTLRVLLPMRNVIDCIESSTGERTRFVRRAKNRLEELYNRMARDALLARLQERLGERIHAGEALAAWELARESCQFVADQYAPAALACIELIEDGTGRFCATGRHLVARRSPQADLPTEGRLADEIALASSRGPSGTVLLPTALGPRTALQVIPSLERSGSRYGLALSLGQGDRAPEGEAAADLLGRVTRILTRSLEALQARYAALERERGRASINLSRNLGHDLTNIIATSKLELMTLEALLGPNAPALNGERHAILGESLRGLLNSTRFLQEVVNLYRAYAFLRHPVLEERDANELINETVRLFSLSISDRVRFVLNLDPEAPKARVDSRLFKLALFNLFSNAVDAIRRGSSGEGGQGTITLTTATASGGGLRVSVHDDGPGIRNERGEPAQPAEIERIFALGYTLGREGEGEGLGLNWVRTIVQEIHEGSILAENAPEGGARFTLTFPPAEKTHTSNSAESAA